MVEDKQVTAVWFLIKELSDKIAFTPGSELALWHAQLYEQALAMEREQMEKAVSHGISKADMINNRGYFNFDKWYNEIYGGQDE